MKIFPTLLVWIRKSTPNLTFGNPNLSDLQTSVYSPAHLGLTITWVARFTWKGTLRIQECTWGPTPPSGTERQVPGTYLRRQGKVGATYFGHSRYFLVEDPDYIKRYEMVQMTESKVAYLDVHRGKPLGTRWYRWQGQTALPRTRMTQHLEQPQVLSSPQSINCLDLSYFMSVTQNLI